MDNKSLHQNCLHDGLDTLITHLTKVRMKTGVGGVIRAPPSKMREPYSDHFVRPSILCCNTITEQEAQVGLYRAPVYHHKICKVCQEDREG